MDALKDTYFWDQGDDHLKSTLAASAKPARDKDVGIGKMFQNRQAKPSKKSTKKACDIISKYGFEVSVDNMCKQDLENQPPVIPKPVTPTEQTDPNTNSTSAKMGKFQQQLQPLKIEHCGEDADVNTLAATVIQSAFHGMSATNELAAEKEAAVKIQAVICSTIARIPPSLHSRRYGKKAVAR